MWSLAYGYHRDRTPSYGYEPTREAAMAAFAKSGAGSSCGRGRARADHRVRTAAVAETKP